MKKIILFIFMIFATLFTNVDVARASGEGCDGQPNSYIDRDTCVPGWITNDTWYTAAPQHITGKAVWYAPYLMNATAEYRGMTLDGFLGGVSLFSPADIGEIVWLQRPGHDWEGPFLVVDASQRNHMWTTLTYVQESIEVDWETARRWGMVSGNEENYQVNEWMIRDVEVYKGLYPPTNSQPVNYANWFREMAQFGSQDLNRPYYGDNMLFADYSAYEIATVGENVLAYSGNSSSIAISMAKEEAEPEEIFVEDEFEVSFIEAHRYNIQVGVMPNIEWEINCEDENAYTGFEMYGFCIPGVISHETWMMRYPRHTIGVSTYYAHGVMDTVLENREMSLNGYQGAIVMMSCAHVGESVWIRRPGYSWEGPFLVADCSQPYHMYMNLAFVHGHMEVDQELWEQWRATSGTQNIEICLGGNDCGDNPVAFWYYWEQRVEWLWPE